MDVFDKCYRFTYAKQVMAAGLYPYFQPIRSAQDPEVVVDGRRMIMVGSNNYLGLTSHPRIMEAAIRAIEKYGTGCAGSRFLNGTIDLHHEVEAQLAKFKKKEAALLFAAGYQTNLGVISALVGKDDVVIIDRWNHASIIDGCRLAFGQTLKYRHNDMEDLERILSSQQDKGKLIVVDGVFSMEGDIVRLPEIVRLARKYGARVMVDDAHATGVLGKEGRGTSEHFGLENEVDIVMGTCSKALASVGGFIASSHEVIHYVKHNARSMMFSASLPPPAWRPSELPWKSSRKNRSGRRNCGRTPSGYGMAFKKWDSTRGLAKRPSSPWSSATNCRPSARGVGSMSKGYLST